MKADQILKLLRITRPTLSKYVKMGTIKVQKLPNGRYDYDEESVYSFLNKDLTRNTVIYARVSTSKQKKDLQNQVDLLKQFCFQNGWQINNIYQDVASGISFEKRKDFFLMLDDILANRIEKIVISYKDRLSRVGFELFSHLFKKFGTEIIVMSEVGSEKLDSQEVFEEIVSLLHCYSMKLYSKRKKKLIQEIINEQS
eukprot:TRINITY_DN11544_c0_g1_i1.p1 TRINITY_DN11544_c0_g1~~TRINITY_DN11544_c0_g1_i1.p1  ORF type:complete len:198 (+),score=13.73 TRINITY_DN11544_c0_g1_i1:316-909(+)